MDNHEKIIQKYYWIINSVIKRYNLKNICKNHPSADIEDIYSLGRIGLWKANENYDKKLGSFKSFAYTCVLCEIFNFTRNLTKSRYKFYKDHVKKYGNPFKFFSIDNPNTKISLNSNQEHKIDNIDEVEHYLKCLNEYEKKLIDHFFYKNFSIKEIALKENKNPATISLQFKNISEKLRRKLKINSDESLVKPNIYTKRFIKNVLHLNKDYSESQIASFLNISKNVVSNIVYNKSKTYID
jgi:RNA polymerase sigma factor (sigma-70 family)